MLLRVSENDAGRTAALVFAYAGRPCEMEAACAALELRGDGAPTVGLVPICRQLARSSANPEQLLGGDAAAQAAVLEWLTWAESELDHVSDEKLAALAAHLAGRTFLAGGAAATLADLVVFGVVHSAVSKLPPAQHDQLVNLLRWFDLLQHTADGSRVFTPLAIARPAFVPPPPPPAPSTSARTAGAASASAASTSAASNAGGGAAGEKQPKKEKAAAAASAAGAAAAGAAAAGAAAAAAAAGSAGDGGGKPSKKAKEAKNAGKEGKPKKEPAPKEADEPRIDMLDIRVGRIVAVQQHPNADALYLEEIDVGEDKPRQVISGLVKFVPKEQMENRRVVVCCNLKPAKMRDIMSYGMVLCASNDAHDRVEPITPPEGVPVGERITFEGYANAPLEEVNPKRKILERLFPDLKTLDDGTPAFKGVPFMTSRGPVTSSLPGAHVA